MPLRCGRQEFELHCQDSPHPLIESATVETQPFRGLGTNKPNQTMTIAKNDINYADSDCFGSPECTTFNQLLFNYSPNVRTSVYSIVALSNRHRVQIIIVVKLGSEERIGFYTVEEEPDDFLNLTNTCSEVIKVPIPLTTSDWIGHRQKGEWLREALDLGFDVKYQAENVLCSECQSSRGICRSNQPIIYGAICA
ncbi:hypothetical protein Patl1_19160 [Pistacia atlantica]|uniref:Uncharacterized protein n=1 Tax=Pistacia atlantica TaxID=434234 RepID=A0ACC1C168_9ROSI|nr:hypothetical protein Patl1_19160 [Pistacia atlantica]